MTANTNTVLIQHDDAAVREQAASLLAARNISCEMTSNWDELELRLDSPAPAAVLFQAGRAQPERVAEMVTGLRRWGPATAIIVVLSNGDLESARRAFRAGAWDCLKDPLCGTDLYGSLVEAHATSTSGSRGALVVPATNGNGHTPLSGHAVFLNALGGLRALSRRNGLPLSLLMLDLDRFRECNERGSPEFGDHVLRWFASVLQRVSRRSDVVARYRSDRFIVALPESRALEAARLARRCRREMEREPVVFDGSPHELTVSIGIVESSLGFIETPQQLIERVRIALDNAKRLGGNRTCSWKDLMDAQPLQGELHGLSASSVSHWIERVRQQTRFACMEATRALVAAVEAKDPLTRQHSLTVATYAEAIGKRMKLHTPMLETLRAAALLHDVGKIGVPDAVLTKPGALSKEEFDIVKRHPETALDILGHVSFLNDERPLILHHHERYDGGGYPGGLPGEQIPIGARVLAVADAVDAMFSPRSYKPSYNMEHVRAELAAEAGKQFDPAVAEVTLEWLEDEPQDVLSPTRQAICSAD